jgi:hypothetical protein
MGMLIEDFEASIQAIDPLELLIFFIQGSTGV